MKKTRIFKMLIILLAFFAGFNIISLNKETNIINLDNNKNISSKSSESIVSVNNKYLDVTEGSALTLDLSITDGVGVKSYKSLDSYILEVSNTGVIYGKHKGTGQVLVTLSDDSTKTLNVNVCDNPESLEIYTASNYLVEGESTQVVASVKPIGSNRNITYTTDNKDVSVEVDGTINVASNATGTVTITATTTNNISTSKTFTILKKTSYTANVKLARDTVISINQSDIDTYEKINLYCENGTESHDDAPTYYVELNNIDEIASYTGSSVITILADGYVNINFIINGNVTLIGNDYLGIQVISIKDSDDPHAKITFNNNELKSVVRIGYTDTLSTEEESGLGNATFKLASNITSDIDVSSLDTLINNMSGKSVPFTLYNNLNKTIELDSEAKLYGNIGDTINLGYTLNLEDLSFSVNYISSNTDSASINADELSLNSLGQTIVSVESTKFDYLYDFIILNVYEEHTDDISVIDITNAYGTNELILGETYTLNVSSSNYIIESSDDSVLKVNDDLTITALANGEATLSVYYKNNTKISTKKEYKVIIRETDILINDITDNYPIYINNTFDLSKYVTVIPNEATYKDLTYTSSDTLVLTIDKSGLISAVKSGTAIVTITSKGGLSKQITFKVLIPVEEITTDIETKEIIETGSTFDLSSHISVLPIEASNKEVTYTSSNNLIATVDNNGLITTLTKGEFSITVTSVDQESISKVINFESYISVQSIDTSNLDSNTRIYDKGTLDLSKLISVVPSNATNTNLTYESSDTSVLTVDETGKVLALSSGKAKITVIASDNVSTTIEIESYIKATSIETNLDSTKIEKGATLDLASLVTLLPLDATNKTLTYTSSDSSILSISSEGVISAKSSGSATITIHQADIEKTIDFECIISVSGIEKTNESSLNQVIEKGDTLDIKNYFNVLPLDATNKNVIYSIDNSNCASIEDGIITTLNKGNFNLSIITLDGSYSISFDFEVYVSVKDIEVEIPDNNVFKVNETYQIKAHVVPIDANVQTLTYYTTTNKATVNSNGLVTFVELGKDNGEVKITIRSNESNIEKTLTLYVVQPVTDIKINNSDNLVLPVGQTLQLNYTIYPTNASNKEVKYTSSNSSIASISDTGVITSLSIGEVLISVSTMDGTYKDSITLYCGPHVESIEIQNKETQMKVGESLQIKVLVLPNDAANQKYTYSTSNSDIASVSDSGLVVANKTGQVRITVTTIDGGKVSSITLNVKNTQDKPAEIETTNVLVYNDSVVILNPLSTVEYRLVDSNSNVIYDWTQELVNNKIIFDNLSDNTTYRIEYRTIGTAYKDASDALSFEVKTEKNQFVRLNTGLIVLMFIGGILVLGLVIFFIIKGIKKKKKAN